MENRPITLDDAAYVSGVCGRAKSRAFFQLKKRPVGEPQPKWGAIPERALRMNLTGVQVRVLACVAMHDMMSLENGGKAGCFATTATIGERCAATRETVSRAVTVLEAAGLIVADEKRRNRAKVWRVVYEEIADDPAPESACDEAMQRLANLYPNELIGRN